MNNIGVVGEASSLEANDHLLKIFQGSSRAQNKGQSISRNQITQPTIVHVSITKTATSTAKVKKVKNENTRARSEDGNEKLKKISCINLK